MYEFKILKKNKIKPDNINKKNYNNKGRNRQDDKKQLEKNSFRLLKLQQSCDYTKLLLQKKIQISFFSLPQK